MSDVESSTPMSAETPTKRIRSTQPKRTRPLEAVHPVSSIDEPVQGKKYLFIVHCTVECKYPFFVIDIADTKENEEAIKAIYAPDSPKHANTIENIIYSPEKFPQTPIKNGPIDAISKVSADTIAGICFWSHNYPGFIGALQNA